MQVKVTVAEHQVANLLSAADKAAMRDECLLVEFCRRSLI